MLQNISDILPYLHQLSKAKAFCPFMFELKPDRKTIPGSFLQLTWL